MPRFFVRASQISDAQDGKRIEITGDDASHISRSLRMKAGERITICDMAGREYSCVIETLGGTVTARVTDERQSENEPPCRITVYQALVRGEKFDTVVQKAVECGACRIVPVRTSRSEIKLDCSAAEKKTARWQRIALEAAKQCGRGALPEVCGVTDFKDGVRLASEADLPFLCYEDARKVSIASVLNHRRDSKNMPATISVFVGPEGGFSVEEADLAAAAGLIPVGLGPRILRTETASSFALACISCILEMQDQMT